MAGEQKAVGTINCFCCGEQAEVRQAAARGRHLYISCGNCGTMQGQKKVMQTRIWKEAEFKQGITVVKPSNVTDEPCVKAGELLPSSDNHDSPEKIQPEPDSQPEAVDDFDPDSEPEEIQPEPETSSKKGWVALGIIGLAAVGGALLS